MSERPHDNRTPTTQPQAVSARELIKRYEQGRIVALDGMSLSVAQGEFVAICGPSGCGKSTLLNLLAAIDKPDGGSVSVCGVSLDRMIARAADVYRTSTVGLVFQLHNCLPNLTALENVQTPMIAAGVPAQQRIEAAVQSLERVGLADRMHALPSKLSGGERQRVAIARALANGPRVLLADEPTGALDSRNSEQLFDLLEGLQAERGMTLIVVTHDRHIAARARRVVQMLDGREVAEAAA